MNSPASSSESRSFDLLDRRIQRWIWSEGWSTLRDIQEQSIPVLLEGAKDVIISAATASGKTEAAFFPILSSLLRNEVELGSVLYISPLKALINDQWGRLSDLCQSLEIPVVPWHGDIPSSRKHKFLEDPRGVLLITPESLEALFVTRGSLIPVLVRSLKHIVVDELHSFIGSERGKQLQSLLHRAQLSADHHIPRVALSATLGDMRLAAEFLRPGLAEQVCLLDSKADRQELRVVLKSFLSEGLIPESGGGDAGGSTDVTDEIASDLYVSLRGNNNLVFPNSRALVETYADLLRRMCERDGIPNEFWAHHGNLSRELREETEHALKARQNAATAVCTSTLELGIDIGSVKSIAQIGPPPSVASMRQRLGRSGRRAGEPAILRCYCTEASLTPKSSLSDRLREGLVQTIATVRLLVNGWFEPPDLKGLHASTFVQQVLSVIAERCGASAGELWGILVDKGPFRQIAKSDFVSVLKEMGTKDLLAQDKTGLLLHGGLGERLVNHYDFYAAFVSEDEFEILYEGHPLGTLPVNRPLQPEQRIIFGGRRWKVIDADSDHKRISVVPDPGGLPPMFDSAGAFVHDRVRQEMRKVLGSDEPVLFLDATGTALLSEARSFYRDASLDHVALREEGDDITLFTWCGDQSNDALALVLSSLDCRAWNEGVALRVRGRTLSDLRNILRQIAAGKTTDPYELDLTRAALIHEKWDWALPDLVLQKSAISARLDFEGARQSAAGILRAH